MTSYSVDVDDCVRKVRMHMLDPFKYAPCRTPMRAVRKTSLMKVQGSKILTTTAAGTFHVGMGFQTLDAVTSSFQASNPATSTFTGAADVSPDAMQDVMSAPVPNWNSATIVKKVISAALKVKYIGRDDERAGVFYGYTLQKANTLNVPAWVQTIDNAQNNIGFCSTPVQNGLINCWSPATQDHFNWSLTIYDQNDPSPTLKIVGIGLPASKAVVLLEYSYTFEFIPLETDYDKYDLQYCPFGETGSQGGLREEEKCRPLYN